MKTKLTIGALALATAWLVPPAALAQTNDAGAGPLVAANDAAAAQSGHHAKRHHKAKKRSVRDADGAVRCQVLRDRHWHQTDCNTVPTNLGATRARGGYTTPLPPPPPPPAPPAAEPPAPPPVPEIPAALLQPSQPNEISLGAQWVGGHNTGQYGRYNGFTSGGVDFLLGFSVHKRAPWNSDDAFYYDVSGLNLDFQTGSHLARGFRDGTYTSTTSNRLGPMAELNHSFGEQGKWGVTASYSATSYAGNIISSLWTINGNMGVLNNGLVAWGGASNNPLTKGTTTSFTATTLSPNFDQFQVGTPRDAIQVGGKFVMDEWTFATNIQHEHKQGSLEESLRETYGGMAFTLPVDYDTDRFDLSASYVDPDYQALIQYTYSRFTDNNTGVILPYVVSISSLSAGSGPYAQSAFYCTPPRNTAHYLTVMVAYKLSPSTRAVFNGRVGVELQDSTFAPNSADPNLSSTLGSPTYSWFTNLNALNQGTSATSPHAKAWIYQGNLTVTSNLATHLDARATYSIDGRSVDINQYKVWIGGPSPDAQANTAVYVVPQSWTKQNANLEVGYLVDPESSTKVTASYTFNNTNRTNAQVEHSITNTVSLAVSTMIGSDLMGRISYEHGNRSGTMHYGTAWGNLESGTPEADGTPSGAYYQAPMTSDAVVLRIDYAPIGDLSGGLFLKGVNNHYRYPAVDSVATSTNSGTWTAVGHGEGITRDYNFTVGPDVNYRLSNDINLHVYYTYERIFFDNRGNGACAESNTGSCAGSAGYFQNKYTSSMNTAGISGDWKVGDNLKLGAEYNLSTGSVIFGQYNGVMVTTVTQSYQNVTPYPDINSTMHDLKLTAIYQITSNIEGSLMYRYSMFNNSDWGMVPMPVIPTTNTGTAISIVNAGYGSPNYNVSTIGMVLKMRL